MWSCYQFRSQVPPLQHTYVNVPLQSSIWALALFKLETVGTTCLPKHASDTKELHLRLILWPKCYKLKVKLCFSCLHVEHQCWVSHGCCDSAQPRLHAHCNVLNGCKEAVSGAAADPVDKTTVNTHDGGKKRCHGCFQLKERWLIWG